VSEIFRQLFEPHTCSFAYLLASGRGAEALIIDPVRDEVPKYLQLIEQLGVRLTLAIDTHFHADHVTGTGALREAVGARVAMGRETAAETVCTLFADGDTIGCDGVQLRVIHTPGHTPDSYCLHQGERLFTGDTLLIGGAGRTDLPGGDARAHFHSLRRILAMAPDTTIYPGHDYNGRTRSSLAEERANNPRLQFADEAAYAAAMARLDRPPPQRFALAMEANRRLGLTHLEPERH
jgi:glyoxylase-like metal-dependent hydrolase (beta-lactamase superfamily II)